MDFSLTDDHVALQDAVRRFCDGEYPAHKRGESESPELAQRRWAGLAQMGLLGLALPEADGGGGHGAVETMLVAHEFGRCLGGTGWLSTVLCAQVIAQAGTPAQRAQWLPRVAAGEARLALATSAAGAHEGTLRTEVRARRVGSGWRLDGRCTLVPDCDHADAWLVPARTTGEDGAPHGVTLFVVDARAHGLGIHGFPTLDGRRAAHLELRDIAVDEAAVLGKPGDAWPLVQATIERGTAAVCAEAAGAQEALLDLCIEHVKTRQQFGAPLASFQVLQHVLSDMLMDAEQCRSMACAAALAVEEAPPTSRRRVVSAAKVVIGQAGRHAGQRAIQLHGAMGMTDECRVGHYTKRLLVIDQLFGSASEHLTRFTGQSEADRFPPPPTKLTTKETT